MMRGAAPPGMRFERYADIAKRIAPVGLRLVGPLLFIALLAWVVEPRELVETLRDVDAGWAIATVAVFHVVILLRTLRWVVVHRLFELRTESFAYHARLSYATSLTSVTMPQVLSPFARFLMLAQDGQPRMRSAGASLVEKASEFGAYVAFGLAGFGYFALRSDGGQVELTLPVIGGLLAIAVALWAVRARLASGARRVGEVIQRRIGEPGTAVEHVVDREHVRPILLVALGAIAVAAAQVAATYCATRAVGLDLSPALVTASWGLVALSMLLPISVNGIGTREGIYVVTFASAGVSRDAAFASSIVVVAAAIVASLPGVFEIAYRLMFLRRAPEEARAEQPAEASAGADPA